MGGPYYFQQLGLNDVLTLVSLDRREKNDKAIKIADILSRRKNIYSAISADNIS